MRADFSTNWKYFKARHIAGIAETHTSIRLLYTALIHASGGAMLILARGLWRDSARVMCVLVKQTVASFCCDEGAIGE